MYMIARLYESEAQAEAAVAGLLEIGVPGDNIAVLSSPDAGPSTASTDVDADVDATEVAAAVPAADPDAMATAVKAGKMLGSRADYYLSRLEAGRSLLVAQPHFMISGAAEKIMDAQNPLPYSHEPARKEFVPISQQATPFSDWLGLPVLTEGTPFSDALGFKSTQEGLSHLSRWFPPLATDFTLSSKVGWGFKSKSDTPLSSMLNWKIKSDRLEGKDSSFGMKLKADRDLPFSSLLGLPVLAKRKHFLTGENENIS